MFERIKLNSFEDYFVPCSGRSKKGVYVCRLTKYSQVIHEAICKYIEFTRKSGVCISGRIGNPDENQLKYYDEMMGRDFQLNPNFFMASLNKWLPRIHDQQKKEISNSFYDIFIEMQRSGKNENMQKNAYIKFMCWMYYKFEAFLHQLGSDQLPKILFEGYPNFYELKMFSVLSKAGCDILLLEYKGDEPYLQVDRESQYSQLLDLAGQEFPGGYSILNLRKELFNRVPEPALMIFKTEKQINTNTWIKGDLLSDSLIPSTDRGTDSSCFYNLFAGLYGVEDKSGYYQGLLTWNMKLESMGKFLLLAEDTIPAPTFDETSQIKRKNCPSAAALLNEMVMQISCSDRKLMTYCQHGFMTVMKDQSTLPLQKLMNLSAVMICWINRYAKQLSSKWESGAIFLYYGEVKTNNESLFLRFLAQLPIDVLIINPELNETQMLQDPFFFAKNHQLSLKREPFPKEVGELKFGTVAFEAEQELNTLMYQDTGIYRNHQFKGAIAVPLHNTFEEIAILWREEAKYRPNFETFDDRVMVPVIFSKVSGIQGKTNQYWDMVCDLVSENDYVIKGFPHSDLRYNPFKDKVPSFLYCGKLEIKKIKSHPNYPFAFIREPMQDYMLSKLQELIDQKIIVGTGVNGMENTIVATIFNMDKRLLQLIQQYDFTKQIPKVVAIHTKERNSPPEDSILLAYLHKIGFDIVLFVPTGYLSIERYYSKPLFLEHQIGEYKYDLRISDFENARRRKGFAAKLFRRGK